ncbi:MAG TPA: class 1 fructose-bisphosphatase [Proteobacteria bacterium]|nr:fructose-1,6-bisphosphatase class 1 [bacterium BMS3Abin14]HDL52473.1 class 1 fructose-bisphosphatase [Pseudomonadota bacterium]
MSDSMIGVNLTRHIAEKQKEYPQATGELTGILNQVAFAAKIVSREVNKAGLVEILGLTGEKNVQGEEVQKLDDFANSVFVNILGKSGHFCIMATEEETNAILIPDGYNSGQYSIAFDPLDGSSNIDVNVNIGTIFAIHRKVSGGDKGVVADLLQVGRKLVAAGYIVYGSSTILVISTGNGVHGFTLDPSVGEFLESHPFIRIPEKGDIYSINEGNSPYWSEGVRQYIGHIKEKDRATGRPHSARYIGSMVADMHRTLIKGGSFMYPADTKDPKKPNGKLRILYECAPMAFLVEHAGGAASTGTGPVLDVLPTGLHQRTPFYAGSVENIRDLERFIAKYDGRLEFFVQE